MGKPVARPGCVGDECIRIRVGGATPSSAVSDPQLAVPAVPPPTVPDSSPPPIPDTPAISAPSSPQIPAPADPPSPNPVPQSAAVPAAKPSSPNPDAGTNSDSPPSADKDQRPNPDQTPDTNSTPGSRPNPGSVADPDSNSKPNPQPAGSVSGATPMQTTQPSSGGTISFTSARPSTTLGSNARSGGDRARGGMMKWYIVVGLLVAAVMGEMCAM